MLTVSVWYRGRALPLAWAVWSGQQPLTDQGFWERVAGLLSIVAKLLPLGVPGSGWLIGPLAVRLSPTC